MLQLAMPHQPIRIARALSRAANSSAPSSSSRTATGCKPYRRLSSSAISASPGSTFRKILALESSADDTCAAVVDSSRRILSSVVRKQHDIHREFRGIHPMHAQHAHIRAMPGVIRQALDEASTDLSEIDAFAFTQGPGMFQCLSVSCVSAAAMASSLGKPLIGVNHMQGHALTPLMTEADPPEFPFLTLLVSGGHTQLVLANSFDDFDILVETGSIPIGNAFDTVASLLQIPPHPTLGFGPGLEAYALLAPSSPSNPLPALSRSIPSPVFEYGSILASLKEALHTVSPLPGSDPKAKHEFALEGLSEAVKRWYAREFQDQAVATLEDGVRRVLKRRRKEKKARLSSLVVSGGVACNQVVRRRLTELGAANEMRVLFPPVELCTDNAAMIGNAAVHRLEQRRFNSPDDCLPRRKWSIKDVMRSSQEVEDATSRS